MTDPPVTQPSAGTPSLSDKPRRGHLSAQVRLVRGAFVLDVAIDVQPGEIVAVLGPNGAGKSTLLGVLAGLVKPDSGQVVLGGRVLTDSTVHIPPEHRRVGLMGQDPMLFPHLTAAQNIAFGPRSQGVPRHVAATTAREWLERLDVADFGARRPADLSGGQRQRVALARALAAEPELLLLDEPLGALDAQTAPEIRHVLRTHLRATGTSTIVVTHDVLDAATVADRVIVIAHGTVIDSGPTATVLASPRSEFSAALAGLNLVRAEAQDKAEPGMPVAATVTGGAGDPVLAAGHRLTISGMAAEGLTAAEPVAAVFAPAAVAVYLEPPGEGSPRNSWPAIVDALEPGPAAIRVRATLLAPRGPTGVVVSADVTAASIARLGLRPGSRIQMSIKATEVQVHRVG